MRFGKRLKELREVSKMTQKEVAGKIGVSERVYSYYEDERFPKDERILSALADCFGVSVDYLVGDKNQKQIPAEFVIMARKAGEMPEEDRRKLYDIFDQTIDMFLEKTKSDGDGKKQ